MATNFHSTQKDQREENHNLSIEVSNKEKHLVMLIHTKGLLNTDVQELYRRVRSGYEKIILNDNEQSELQDIEYCLWKLHYKHIDEFRKRIKNNTTSQSTQLGEQHNSNHLKGFILFLSEATEFYQSLIVKIRKYYGLSEEPSFSIRGCISRTSESKKTQICQFLCHRFLVCLGDLARYREQHEKPDVQNHSWSMAATHYMQATAIWPDSGNPQNQLAVLATYVGDEFLALYHCIRSLAVKEPFPDAHDNLIVLLERNWSSFPPSLSSEAHFNFLKPSERCVAKANSKSSDELSSGNALKAKNSCAMETNIWSLFIKIISFFFIKSSFDDFPFAFASIMRELDGLMALDDKELKASLESYQSMDSVKTGPFRALQVVSIFLYTLENLINIPQTKDFKDTNGARLIVHRNWALLSTFVFMGRFVDRCIEASSLNSCPLLPAVLVFVEWLATRLNEPEKYRVDEKCRIAMSYFFGSFVDFLRRIRVDSSSGDSSTSPLWEDYELRGFTPVACAQESLDFSSHWERMDNLEDGSESRVHRLINAGWIIHDQSRRNFINPCVTELIQLPETKQLEKPKHIGSNLKTAENGQNLHKNVRAIQTPRGNPKADGNIVTVEDEEVILFNPLTRYHSAPVCSNSNERTPPKGIENPTIPADDFLRHATSLLIAQNQVHGCNPSADIGNFRNYKSFEQQEPIFKDCAAAAHPLQHTQPISAGPPSLSAWVIDDGNLIIAKEKAPSGVSPYAKHVLGPIDELASDSLNSLSITEKEDSSTNAGSSPTKHHASSPYAAPTPSAPLLPDDAAWYAGLYPSFHNFKAPEVESIISKTETLSHAPSQSAVSSSTGHANWTPAQAPTEYALSSLPGPALILPTQRQMTSSEWLRHYLQTQHNLVDRSYNNHAWPSYYYATTGSPGNSSSLTSNATMQVETSPLYTALPLDYSIGTDVHRRDKLLYGYQRPSPYVCGALTDVMISEPQPLLQYLKERERQLQALDPGATLMRGPTYMGN